MRLVTVDLNGTLLPHTTAFAVVLRGAGRTGLLDEVLRRRAAREVDVGQAITTLWPEVRSLTLQEVHRHLRRHDGWLRGIGDGVARLRAACLEARLLTDQPSTITDFAGRWGFLPAIASPVAVHEGVQGELDLRLDKLANLTTFVDAQGIGLDEVCHIGNGANDVPVFEAVGRSIAMHAPPDVAAAADVDLGPVMDFGAVVDAVL